MTVVSREGRKSPWETVGPVVSEDLQSTSFTKGLVLTESN